MLRSVLIGGLIFASLVMVLVWCLAAPKEKAPVLTAVTVTVKGLQCPMSTKLGKELVGVDGATDVKATLKPPQVTCR